LWCHGATCEKKPTSRPPGRWSGLGVKTSPDGNKSDIVLLVSGSSHHAWTHPDSEIAQESVKQAKLAIQNQMLAWLDEDD